MASKKVKKAKEEEDMSVDEKLDMILKRLSILEKRIGANDSELQERLITTFQKEQTNLIQAVKESIKESGDTINMDHLIINMTKDSTIHMNNNVKDPNIPYQGRYRPPFRPHGPSQISREAND